MNQKAEDITIHAFDPSEELLLDANIWLLVYGPQKPKNRRVTTYSGALKNIFAAKSRIYIDVLIVSEFVNAYARLKYYTLRVSEAEDFKQFRQRAAFKPVAQDIAADVKRILRHCTRIGSGFESLDTTAVLDEYAAGNSDFNDQILVALCKKKGLKMVTDETDFKERGIPIITANKRLLR